MLTGPRTLLVCEGLKPAVAFEPPPCAGHRVRRGGATPPVPPAPVILVNGKATDGREKLLHKAVFTVACDLRRAGETLTADGIFARAWALFGSQADLSDGKWTADECHHRAVRLMEKVADGRLRLPAETSGLAPHWRPDPKPVDEVRQELRDGVRMFSTLR